jgi:hypothetical protein
MWRRHSTTPPETQKIRLAPPRTIFIGENDEDEMGYCSVSFLTKNRPRGTNEFMNYFFKLREGALLKKAFHEGK